MKRNIIVGAQGDLGSQLADISEQAGLTTIRVGHEFRDKKDELVLGASDYVHLCIPAGALSEYAWLQDEPATVVLHDSVMNTSVMANHAHFGSQATVVHMLMNANKSVVIESDSTRRDNVAALFAHMGLSPTVLSAPEHDQIMAVSQAPLALLCQVIQTPIKRYREMGLLTASGEELERALDARSAKWTPATIQSLLQNPQLRTLVDDMQATLSAAQQAEHDTRA